MHGRVVVGRRLNAMLRGDIITDNARKVAGDTACTVRELVSCHIPSKVVMGLWQHTTHSWQLDCDLHQASTVNPTQSLHVKYG